MDPEVLIAVITENPVTSGIMGTALAALAGFFRPIMRALQAALVRRIDQAWVDDDSDHDERVRRTAERVRRGMLVTLPRGFVETQVRIQKSEAPPPL